MTQSTQGCKYLNGKYHKNRTLGSGSYRSYNVGSYNAGTQVDRTSGHYKAQPGHHYRSQPGQQDNSSRSMRVSLLEERGTGLTKYTTPGCIGSGPKIYPIPGIDKQETLHRQV